MRSRKPDTRATMSTWRELSVCATKFHAVGMVCALSEATLTTGAGRSAFGASALPHAASARAAEASSSAGFIVRFIPRISFPERGAPDRDIRQPLRRGVGLDVLDVVEREHE